MTPFNFHWWIQVLPFDWWKDEEKYLLLAKMTHFLTYCWKLITFPIKLVGLFQMSDWFSNGISEILKIIFKISFLNKENCRDSRTIMIYVFRNQICKTCEYKISLINPFNDHWYFMISGIFLPFENWSLLSLRLLTEISYEGGVLPLMTNVVDPFDNEKQILTLEKP